MNPSIISVLLHLGSLISTFKDVEKAVSDVISGKASAADGQALLQDVAGLLTSGLINIPGLTSDQLAGIATSIKTIA